MLRCSITLPNRVSFRRPTGPKLAEFGATFGPELAEPGRNVANLGQLWPKQAKLWTMSGQHLVEFGRVRSRFGQARAEVRRIRTTSAISGPNLGSIARSRSQAVCRTWPNLAESCPTLTGSGQIGSTWMEPSWPCSAPNSGPNLEDPPGFTHKFVESGPDATAPGPQFGRVGPGSPKVERLRQDVARVR